MNNNEIKTNIVSKKGVERNGKVGLPYIFDDIDYVEVDGKESDNIFKVILDGDFGIVKIVDSDEMFCHVEYKLTTPFASGAAVVAIYDERHGEKYALMDLELNLLTEFEFEQIEYMYDEYYCVRKKGLYGIMKSDGELVIDCMLSTVVFDSKEKSFTAMF